MDCSRPKTRDPEEWLENAPDFSRPIAHELRELILRWEPDLSEAIKWNMLCFSGRKLVCGISACKRHVSIAFFRGTELSDPAGLFSMEGEANTNLRSVRLTSAAELRPQPLKGIVQAAVALDADPEVRPAPKVKREPLAMPDFFTHALAKHPQAAAGFAQLSASCQREYIVWVGTAKRDETKASRLQQTLRALSKGHKWIDRKG